MTIYAGLDVSDKATHICVVDGEGAIAWRGVCATDPEVLARTLRQHCPDLVRAVLETGSLSAFLYHGLVERDVPAVCICARHAKGVLSARVNKSDAHDAEGSYGDRGVTVTSYGDRCTNPQLRPALAWPSAPPEFQEREEPSTCSGPGRAWQAPVLIPAAQPGPYPSTILRMVPLFLRNVFDSPEQARGGSPPPIILQRPHPRDGLAVGFGLGFVVVRQHLVDEPAAGFHLAPDRGAGVVGEDVLGGVPGTVYLIPLPPDSMIAQHGLPPAQLPGDLAFAVRDAHRDPLGVGKRRLGHQRPQAGLLGFAVEVRDLLVGDRAGHLPGEGAAAREHRDDGPLVLAFARPDRHPVADGRQLAAAPGAMLQPARDGRLALALRRPHAVQVVELDGDARRLDAGARLQRVERRGECLIPSELRQAHENSL